ncbi:TRAP transporter small permease [Acuticoccus sediminis]|uniref:TRAP transporter small permease n=1 Tax=Acuticoccus sediminis TaxID=2184697 RepID=UPI001CFF3CB4|nr:TRAP transporter small permease [Acuticoccus sediminis]
MADGSNRNAVRAGRGPLAAVETALVAISCAAMALMMFVVVADVTVRYAFNAPFSWSYDFVGMYLMVGIFFLGLSEALREHDHIAVDLFRDLLPLRIKNAALSAAYVAACVAMGLIGWGGWQRFAAAWANGDRIAATVAWPTWVPYALVTVGSFAMLLRCLQRVIAHARAAATGVEAPGLLPLAANHQDAA